MQIRVDVPFGIAADAIRVIRFFQTERDVPPFVVGACFAGKAERQSDSGGFWIDRFFLFRG